MGDSISMQYGGSIAHHSQLGEKKGIFKAVPEWVTGIKRHLANNFSDPYRQSVINLFLGIYQPLKNPTPIWNLTEDKDTLVSSTGLRMQQDFDSRHHMELALPDKWWERHFRGYEATMPIFLMKNLATRFSQEPAALAEPPTPSQGARDGSVVEARLSQFLANATYS